MTRIIKWTIFFAVLTILIFFAGFSVHGEEAEVPEDLISASGADKLPQSLSPEVSDVLDKYGIEAGSAEVAEGFGFSEIVEIALDSLKSELTSPLSVFLSFASAIALSAFAQSIQGGLKGGMDTMTGLISVIAGAAASVPQICSCFLRVKETVLQCTDFMTAFTPVFAGIVITGGSPMTGAGYYTAVYSIVNIIMQVMSTIFLPMLSMCIALAVTDGVSSNGSMGGILRFLKTFVTWSLGFIMTIFLGMLSIQGIVRSAGDSFGTKTARYVVSNFVPFVGGAVSDAYGTVLGCMKILRSSTGFVGIAALCILFLPVLIQLVLYRFAVSAAAALSELFSASSLNKLLRGIELTLQMTLAVFICFFVMFLVAIAMVLLISGSMV